ncbi:MAG: EamA family transporter [Bacteroidetes bacterium]|nr:EamA family transporter [Fibrella sp.]
MQTLTSPAPAKLNPVTLWSALVAVYIIWGSTYLFAHFMTERMPPLYMSAIRFLVAGSLLYTYARLTGTPAPARRDWSGPGRLGLLMLAIGNGCITVSLQYLPSGMAALLSATFPIFLLSLNWLAFSKTRPTTLAMVGLLLGMIGVYFLVKPDNLHTTGDLSRTLIGGGFVVVANIAWAFGTLLSSRLSLPAQNLSTAMQMLSGGIILLITSLLIEPITLGSIIDAPPKALYSLIYLIIFGSIIGFSSYAWLARHAPPQLVSTYAYVNPVVALLLGATFAGEVLTSQSLIGAGIIVSGVVLITLGRK